jgi:hypothetical protein
MRTLFAIGVVLLFATFGLSADPSNEANKLAAPPPVVLTLKPGTGMICVPLRKPPANLDLQPGHRVDVYATYREEDGNLIITPLMMDTTILAVDCNCVAGWQTQIVVSFGVDRTQAELFRRARDEKWKLLMVPRKPVDNR